MRINKRHIAAVAAFLLTTAQPGVAQEGKSTHGCSLIDEKHQSQFILYERLENADVSAPRKQDVVLRFRNNTDCEVTLITLEEPRKLKFEKLPDGRRKISSTNEFPEGAFINLLKYMVVLQEPPPPANPRKKLIGIDEVNYHLNLKAGQSILFKVPLEHFDKWITIEVPFFYAWDLEPLALRVYHRAYFANFDLPEEIFIKTKVCGKLESCRTKESNKRFERNRRGSQ